MVSTLVVYLYQRATYLRKGPDPVFRTMWSPVYLRFSAIGLVKRLLLLDGNSSTLEAKLACGVHVCYWYKKDIDVGTARPRDTRSTDTV